MISKALLDAQVAIDLPSRTLMSITSLGIAGFSARLGDVLQLYLLPLIPIPAPFPFSSPFM